VRVPAPLLWILSLLCLLALIGWRRQPAAGRGPTGPLTVSVEWPQNGATYQAPATVRLLARVDAVGDAKGDEAVVDFFANTNKLGSRTAFWHEGIRPDPTSRKAQPMIMANPGFGGVSLDWSNVPAGSYTLTARASGWHGLSATSAPVNITVLPAGP
jgi:hypothetical protein